MSTRNVKTGTTIFLLWIFPKQAGKFLRDPVYFYPSFCVDFYITKFCENFNIAPAPP